MKVGIIYSNDSIDTLLSANIIIKYFEDNQDKVVAKSISNCNSIDEFSSYDLLILGSSIWDKGNISKIWEIANSKFSFTNFNNKKIALFDTNNFKLSSNYFIDAIGIIFEKLLVCGAIDISVNSSKNLWNNFKRSNLVSFNINKPHTEEAIRDWARQLRLEAQSI